jgi:integrase
MSASLADFRSPDFAIGNRTARPVSRRSVWSDPVWELDINVAGRRADQKRVRWGVALADGARLTDPQHAELLEAARQFLWSMAVDPPHGRRRSSPSSLFSKAGQLLTLIRWMVGEGFTAFSSLDRSAADRYQAFVRRRRGPRPGTASPATVGNHLRVLKDLYQQRAKLPDALGFDPFPHTTAGLVAGVCRATRRTIPFIPDAVAIDLISKALHWIERETGGILEQRDRYQDALQQARGRCIGERQCRRYAFHAIQARLKEPHPPAPGGRLITTKHDIDRCLKYLIDACFIVIAGFVGMRASAILSIQAGAIGYSPLGAAGAKQAYLDARLFKTAEVGGRRERWLAPDPVITAVAVLERVSEPLRLASGRDELFLTHNTQYGQVVGITNMHINWRIREFAAYNGVRHHEGQAWPFSTHQFRKTFARFIARRDRSQLLALADHLKHVSVAMTAKGYVGTDFDLHQLVDHEGQIETATALDRFLSADRLAGKMGERIAAGNASFRGRAGEQVRRDYITFVLKETDLSIHACEYGWCVFQAETARCSGRLAPDPAGRSPAVCLDCANFVVEPKHAPYWRERRERNCAVMPHASRLTRAALDETIAQCDRVLSRLEENNAQDHSGGTPQSRGPRLPSRTRPSDRRPSKASRLCRTSGSHHSRRGR